MNRKLIRQLEERLERLEQERKEVLHKLRTTSPEDLATRRILEWSKNSIQLEMEALQSHIGREKMSHCPAYGVVEKQTNRVRITTHCCFAFGVESYVVEEMWANLCYKCVLKYKEKKEAAKWWRILHGIEKRRVHN
jgi:acetyl-CoA carboxylase carboxyltransferase component